MAAKVKTIARNPDTCDFIVGPNGDLALAEGKEAYAQIINSKMKTQRGEMQLNLAGGIPYMETVFRNRSLLPIWESEVMLMLNSLSFVTNINSYSCKVEQNMVRYVAEIQTDSGEVIINE